MRMIGWSKSKTIGLMTLGAVCAVCLAAAGCVNVKAPERINIGNHPDRIDNSRVPATRSHEHARQLLADAYARNRYLEDENAELEREKDELEDKLDDCEDRYDD